MLFSFDVELENNIIVLSVNCLKRTLIEFIFNTIAGNCKQTSLFRYSLCILLSRKLLKIGHNVFSYSTMTYNSL